METYISVDIEADGPIPGKNNLLSIGAVAFSQGAEEIGEFSVNLLPLTGATPDVDTMAWWTKHPEAYAATQTDRCSAPIAMGDFRQWISCFVRPVFVAYPAGFDFTFVHWYFHRFLNQDPFGFQALDLKSYAMALMGSEFKKTAKNTMPKEWFEDLEKHHSHIAVEDAREQGRLFMKMLEHRGVL